ncbi:MAG: transposase family protein [Gammaproteobacteria bacterium]|nr:transposase family protein [Gammaproteobacteria bacterium]
MKGSEMHYVSQETLILEEKALAATVFAPGARETAEASLIDWYESLGHSHPASILFMEQRGLIKVTGEKSLDDFNCRICKESKSTVPHYQRGTRSIKTPGEMVHIDLAGPFEPDVYGKTYLMVFIDEATRFKSVFGLKTKNEACKQLKTYQDGMQLVGTRIQCIRGDGAGEFGRSRIFRQELGNLGLRWESSPPYTHQQQGLVERAVRQITEGGRAQLARSYLGNEYWFYACQDFTFKANCLPHQALGGNSPYKRLHPGRKPRYQALRKFGQTAYVHIDKIRQGEFSRGKLSKMRPRADRGVLVGHASGASAYVVHLDRLGKVVTSSAVTFDDIPATVPFLSRRPDHWESPVPGVDDASHLEGEIESVEDVKGPALHHHSIFDGRTSRGLKSVPEALRLPLNQIPRTR